MKVLLLLSLLWVSQHAYSQNKSNSNQKKFVAPSFKEIVNKSDKRIEPTTAGINISLNKKEVGALAGSYAWYKTHKTLQNTESKLLAESFHKNSLKLVKANTVRPLIYKMKSLANTTIGKYLAFGVTGAEVIYLFTDRNTGSNSYTGEFLKGKGQEKAKQ